MSKKMIYSLSLNLKLDLYILTHGCCSKHLVFNSFQNMQTLSFILSKDEKRLPKRL